MYDKPYNKCMMSDVVKSRRMKLSGYCVCHSKEKASKLARGRGRQGTTFTGILLNDTKAGNLETK